MICRTSDSKLRRLKFRKCEIELSGFYIETINSIETIVTIETIDSIIFLTSIRLQRAHVRRVEGRRGA